MAKSEFEFNCCPDNAAGGISAIIISPYTIGSDKQIIQNLEPFFQIGDIMTEKNGDDVRFGKDLFYIKLI